MSGGREEEAPASPLSVASGSPVVAEPWPVQVRQVHPRGELVAVEETVKRESPPRRRRSLPSGWATRSGGEDDGQSTVAYGWLLLFVTFVFFVTTMYCVIVSKLVPKTGHPVLDWLHDDTYYSLLVPNTVLVLVMTAYLNWLGLKFFRHN